MKVSRFSSEKENLECPKCKLGFWSASARRSHEEIHETEKTDCESCDRIFPHPALLTEHIKKVHTQHEHADMPDLAEFEFQTGSASAAAPGSGFAEPLMTGVDRTLNPEDAFALLSGSELAIDGEYLKADKARGGEIYLFAINSRDTIARNLKFVSSISCDGFSPLCHSTFSH